MKINKNNNIFIFVIKNPLNMYILKLYQILNIKVMIQNIKSEIDISECYLKKNEITQNV